MCKCVYGVYMGAVYVYVHALCVQKVCIYVYVCIMCICVHTYVYSRRPKEDIGVWLCNSVTL